MAPVDDATSALATYLDEEMPKMVAKYDELWSVEDPEENPYKSKYVARALLEKAAAEVERLLPGSGPSEAPRGHEMLARLALFLGKNLYFCEEVPGAERHFTRSLERYLRSPLRQEPDQFCYIQDVFNQLGMLWCNRHGFSEGMNYLRRAQIMFINRPATVRETRERRANDHYTLTMFYLAQAYGHLQKPSLSARFCALTMSRQLELNSQEGRSKEESQRDPFDCKDWVRNCCSLSDFFINECMFWTAEYLLHAACVMCRRCGEICGFEPEGLTELHAECRRDLCILYATRLKFSRTCAENPGGLGEEIWRGERKKRPVGESEPSEGTRLAFSCSADRRALPAGDEEPIQWDTVFPEVVHLEDEEAHDNRLAEEFCAAEDGAGAEDVLAGVTAAAVPGTAGWLELQQGERVRLPVHFRRLHAETERRVQRANASFFRVRDSNRATEGFDPVAQGPPVAGVEFEAAREIFKLANHYRRRSLEHFLLDGWVTEHVRIMQELSGMYKSLYYWERDRRRTAAMMRRRTGLLTPILEALNPKVYPAFIKQLSFELAEVYQELYELKANGKFPSATRAALFDVDDDADKDDGDVKRAAQCNELAGKSLKYYSEFVDSFHLEGKIPDRVDTDACRPYLTARLNRARLRTKMRGLSRSERVEEHKEALREYEWILDYAQRNPEVTANSEIKMVHELHLCREMAEMLPSKLSRIAAGHAI